MCEVFKKWKLSTVPDSFWKAIQNARGDEEVYKKHLLSLSEDQVLSVIYQFRGLATELIQVCFPKMPTALQDESTETLNDIADWVITQGKEYFCLVYDGDKPFPTRAMIHRPIYSGTAAEVYIELSGKWPAWE